MSVATFLQHNFPLLLEYFEGEFIILSCLRNYKQVAQMAGKFELGSREVTRRFQRSIHEPLQSKSLELKDVNFLLSLPTHIIPSPA